MAACIDCSAPARFTCKTCPTLTYCSSQCMHDSWALHSIEQQLHERAIMTPAKLTAFICEKIDSLGTSHPLVSYIVSKNPHLAITSEADKQLVVAHLRCELPQYIQTIGMPLYEDGDVLTDTGDQRVPKRERDAGPYEPMSASKRSLARNASLTRLQTIHETGDNNSVGLYGRLPAPTPTIPASYYVRPTVTSSSSSLVATDENTPIYSVAQMRAMIAAQKELFEREKKILVQKHQVELEEQYNRLLQYHHDTTERLDGSKEYDYMSSGIQQ